MKYKYTRKQIWDNLTNFIRINTSTGRYAIDPDDWFKCRKDLLAKESNEEYSQRIMMEQVPKDIERSGWFTCNRCGIKFHVDHDITESGALCNSCFSNLVDKTHPTPSPLDEIEEIEEVKFGMDSNQTFENFYDAINSLIRNQNKIIKQLKQK